MDMYRILENFDAVNSKQTLVEGQMKRQLEARAESMSKADFVADAGEYGMKPEEAAEFWIAVNGDDEELDEERRSPEDFDADALAKHKARLAREKQKIMMQRRVSGQDSGKPPVVRDMSEDDVEEGNRFAYNVLKAKAAGKTQADLDGDGEMEPVTEVFPGTTEYELRFGKDDAASAFDKKKIPTGTVYSRRYQDEPESDGDAPKSAGRPVGTGRRLGAKGPSVASKLLTGKNKGGLKEQDRSEHQTVAKDHANTKADHAGKSSKQLAKQQRSDDSKQAFGNMFGGTSSKLTSRLRVREQDDQELDPDEYDQEGQMARQDLHTMVDAARELHAILGSDENLPEWVQSKITKALDYIDTARDYMLSVDAERSEELVSEQVPPGGFKQGDKIIVQGQKGPTGSTTGVFVQQIPRDAGLKSMYAFRFDDKKYPGNTTDTVAAGNIFPANMKESALQGYLGKKKYGADGMKALQQAGRDGASKEKMAKIRAQHDQMDEADITEKAPPGAKAERMVKGIKKSLSKDGHLSDKDQAIAYATTHKARNAGQVEEQDKKDPPFSADKQSPFKKATNSNRSALDTVKALAQKGLADMTTAALKAELKRRDKVEEESTDTRDQHAERAGKKVTRDLEYDMKHKGKDDDKAEKAGKKVTRDIEYDDKKDKKKEVEETTVSGSVSTGGDAPAKSKGGMQFGKGVYEGQVAESFEKKLGSILNEGMSVNVTTDDTGKKSITVSATDADADALGDMLKMAGLFSSESHSQSCGGCGMMHDAGACPQQMEEELANSPDEVYADADYMTQTLSGGLNGPKTTGQTTGAVVNRQDSRQGVMAEAERVKAASESRLWNLYRKI